jgi:hypothetical protein
MGTEKPTPPATALAIMVWDVWDGFFTCTDVEVLSGTLGRKVQARRKNTHPLIEELLIVPNGHIDNKPLSAVTTRECPLLSSRLKMEKSGRTSKIGNVLVNVPK